MPVSARHPCAGELVYTAFSGSQVSGSAPVVAGNIGAAYRCEYGDPVNEAVRLPDLAKSSPSRLLISEAILSPGSTREAGRWDFGEPACSGAVRLRQGWRLVA